MSETLEAYGAFAYAYDQALGHRFFKAVRGRLLALIERNGLRGGSHLDLACGTGLAVELMRSRGWRSSGADASLLMLRVARRRGVPVIATDMRSAGLNAEFDLITCLYDSLNHIRTRKELVATFRTTRRLMHARSLFVFDVNHPDVYGEIWGTRDPFVATGRDYHLEIHTSYLEREARGHALVRGWAAMPDGSRVPIHETHEQRAWKEKEILRALSRSGLEVLEVAGFDPYDQGDGHPVKLLFCCRIAQGNAHHRDTEDTE